MANITELYQMLDKADRLAATGDAQAQQDARDIAAQIKLEEAKQQKSGEFPELLGGAAGATAGASGQVGGKILNVGRNLARAAENVNTLAEQAKINATKPPVPTTVGQFHSPQMVSQYGFGPGAMKNIAHNVSQQMGNPLHASLAERPIPGFQLEGNRMVITPTSMGGTPPAGMPPQAAPSSAFSNAVDRAKQFGAPASRVGGAAMRALGPVAGGFGAGFEGAEAYNRFERGDPIGGTISAIGAGAGAASMYPPAAPIGLPISYGMMGLNYLLDKYRGKPEAKSVLEKAEGGLVGGLSSLQPQQPSALTAQMAQQTPPQLGLPPVHSLDMMSSPNSAGSRPFPDAYNPNMRYAPPFKEGGSTTPPSLGNVNLNDFVTGGGRLNPLTGEFNAEGLGNPVGYDKFGQNLGYNPPSSTNFTPLPTFASGMDPINNFDALGNPTQNSNPYGFTAPTGPSTQALVPYYNKATGESWNAPSGGYTPPSADWTQVGNVIGGGAVGSAPTYFDTTGNRINNPNQQPTPIGRVPAFSGGAGLSSLIPRNTTTPSVAPITQQQPFQLFQPRRVAPPLRGNINPSIARRALPYTPKPIPKPMPRRRMFADGGSTTPAWQREEGKSPSGGLNAVGRASYKRETGGELKAPQPEGGSRKKSFCARMGGMKKKLTSSKTANDPDSRINKALRKWKC